MENPIGEYHIDKSGIYFYLEKMPLPDGMDKIENIHLTFNDVYVGLTVLRDGGSFFFSDCRCSYEKWRGGYMDCLDLKLSRP